MAEKTMFESILYSGTPCNNILHSAAPTDGTLHGTALHDGTRYVDALHADTLYQKRKNPMEAFLMAAVYGAASISLLLLLGIVGYVFVKGFRTVTWNFLTTVTSTLEKTAGIAGNIVNTLYIVVLALMAAMPVGVGAAVYLNEYARPGRLVRLIDFATETLAGIPSVLFGLFGMVFFGEVLGLGYSLLSGAFTLTLMVLPLVIRSTQEALRSVPDSYRSGALGMGASRWYMIRTVLLPSAMPGILTGVILAVGRIVGESAALLFTAGSGRWLPRLGGNFLDNLERLGSKMFDTGGTLTVELYLQMQDGRYDIAFGVGCVLIIVVLCINLLMKLLSGKIRTT